MTVSDGPVDEVGVRRNEHAGWRIKVLDAHRRGGVFVTIVAQKQEALDLAAQLYPVAQIRVIDDAPVST
ncbi:MULTISPECIES: hypothetical protein [unclassified Caballeronia]|uniref:hypothetical protein n=1 Tax=unclassified Caballeronia TaxID=2646786 RepID=UPI0028576C0A|nr:MULTISPECIES: hypothetical protein [unclassified Caballeronia]MDR5754897.1 hypothetical protein [Caballeronia sp. LZ024]MDR5845456.1 hypothetical protein [Caballeronia sp. LZ031]